jgi:hypothetical protein
MICPSINNTTIVGTSGISYDATPLTCTGVSTCDGLNLIFSKFDTIICSVIDDVDEITTNIINLNEQLVIITDDIVNINEQLNICCPTTTTTTTVPPTTTTTSSSTTTTTSSSTTTTTSSSTTTTTSTTLPPTTTTTSSSSTSTTSTSTSTTTTTSTSSTTTTTTTSILLSCFQLIEADYFITDQNIPALGLNFEGCDGTPYGFSISGVTPINICANINSINTGLPPDIGFLPSEGNITIAEIENAILNNGGLVERIIITISTAAIIGELRLTFSNCD